MNGQPLATSCSHVAKGNGYTMSVDMACMVLRVKFDLIWLKDIKPETKARYGHHSVIIDGDHTTEFYRVSPYGLRMADSLSHQI